MGENEEGIDMRVVKRNKQALVTVVDAYMQ